MKLEFNIEGMRDGSCALDIKETLEETPGVEGASVTFEGKTAIVEFDEEVVGPNAISEKIRELGYTATVSGVTQREVSA